MTDALLAAIRAARATGGELVLPDPGWPAAVRAAADERVARARDAGRLGPGTIVTFSSGSTGTPKGIVRSHASWEDSLAPLTERLRFGPDDVVALPGSLGASLYSFGAWHADAVGARVVLPGDPAWGAATCLHTVPTTLRAVLAERARGAWPRLRLAVVAGEPLTAADRDRADRLGVHVVEYYGAAELSMVALRGPAGLEPFPGVECAVRDGVLWVRSPYLMRRYLDGSPGRVDAAGWRTVGDLVAGPPAAFEVLGRGDLAVSTGGHTVVVEDVERSLRALPGVRDAVALGLPHPRLRQVLAVVVEPDGAGPESPDDTAGDGAAADLVAHVRQATAAWPSPSRPRRILAVDRLPRLPGGKPDRAAARRLFP